jgi:exopolysaccharide production protein ExoY
VRTLIKVKITSVSQAMSIQQIVVKRALDITLSIIVLAVAAPLMLLSLLLVALTSRGLPVYGHRRVGLNGVEFKCLKIRTMYSNKPLPEHLKDEFAERYKVEDDPRITPVGRWLRKSSIDELPQLINVLRGQMSLVGPRPVVAEEIEKFFGARAERITSVRPGITGLWQVSGRSNISYDERIELELKYVSTLSLKNDFVIMLKTVTVVLDFGSTS